MNDTVVYRHIKPCGEVFYVGIGCEQRPYSKDSRNQFWHNVVEKYGYEVEVVAEGLSWEMACELEELMILEYGRRDLGTGTLVNLTAGGDGAKNPSIETRRKLSDASKGRKHLDETKQKISNTLKGKHKSHGTKQKISVTNKGNIPANRKLTFDLAQEIRHRYKTEKTTYHKLAHEYGVSHMAISRIINNQAYTQP